MRSPGAKPKRSRIRVEHRGEAAVLDHHRLRQAGRPRGVDHVGEVLGTGASDLRADLRSGRESARSRPCGPAGSSTDSGPRWIRTAGSASASRAARRSGGEAGSSGRAAPPAFQTASRATGTSTVRPSSRATRDSARTPRARRRAASSPARRSSSAKVSASPVPAMTASGFGSPRGLRGEALRHRPDGERPRRVVPLGEGLVARRRGEHRQGRERQRRVGGRRRDLEHEQLAQALGGRRIEQVGVVLQRARESRRDRRTATASDRSGRCRRRRPPPRRSPRRGCPPPVWASSTWTSVWTTGGRLVSRSGWIASTSLPNGRSWWA